MIKTSFQPRQSGCADAFSNERNAGPPETVSAQSTTSDRPYPPQTNGYAAETQRMKAFVGQRQFRAPVADDFARGMQTPASVSDPGASAQKGAGAALAALLAGFARWRRGLSG